MNKKNIFFTSTRLLLNKSAIFIALIMYNVHCTELKIQIITIHNIKTILNIE